MSEILEKNDVQNETLNQEQEQLISETDEKVTENNCEPQEEKVINEESNQNDEITEQNNIENSDILKEQIKGFVDFVKNYALQKEKSVKELDDKREYLISNLGKYDSEEYFQNECFKNLYSSLFSKLGTNLDTEKFINLVDSYVSSRIDLYSQKKQAEKENNNLTDGFDFSSGESKKNLRKLRMQDIPDSELEKYIAKYI